MLMRSRLRYLCLGAIASLSLLPLSVILSSPDHRTQAWWLSAAVVDTVPAALSPDVLAAFAEELGIQKKEDRVRHEPRFQAARCDEKPIQVAVVGGGIAGLSAAYSFLASNDARGCAPGVGNLQPANAAPFFNVTLFESSGRIGGHAWTVSFPSQSGSTYPVDIAFAWTPPLGTYIPLRRFYRKHGLNLTGPLQNSVRVFKANFREITEAEHASHDKECDRLLAVVEQYRRSQNMQILLGATTMRTFWKMHNLTDAFFMERVYPLIRFLIVAGSKGKILDSPAIAGLAYLIHHWGLCYRDSLHGENWFNVAGGAESEVRVMADVLKGRVRLNSPVLAVSDPDRRGSRTVSYRQNKHAIKQEAFDVVVLAASPKDDARMLGDAAPSWLHRCTMEEITVAVHSDAKVMGPDPAVNTAYVVADKDVGYGMASISMYWDSIHGDRITPRPIVTYNAEVWNQGLPFKGEVFRTRFEHLHYPDLKTFLLTGRGLAQHHNSPAASLFFAGSWVRFGFDHGSGYSTGWDAAYSIGARPKEEDFFMTGRQFDDYAGWEVELMATKGGLFQQGSRPAHKLH